MKGQSGLLKCSEHDESFNTPEEFYEHCNEKPHGYSGSMRCQDCGCRNEECSSDERIKSAKGQARCKKCNEILELNVLKRIEKRNEKNAKKGKDE